MAHIDNELQRQLSGAESKTGTVEAVIRLQGGTDQLVPSPDQVEKIAQQVLERVQRHIGYGEKKSHVFSNLGYFVVAADKDFINELVVQPEVAAAVANQRAVTEPKSSKPTRSKTKAPHGKAR